MGDYILEFPNPDHESVYEEFKDRHITEEDVAPLFKHAFVVSDSGSDIDLLDNIILQQAFLTVFRGLESPAQRTMRQEKEKDKDKDN